MLTVAYGLSRLLEKSGQRLAGAGTGLVCILGAFWGQGDGRGARAGHHRGTCVRRWPPRPPASSSPVELLQDPPRVSSQHATLGSCALGAAGTGGGCAQCGGGGAPVGGTGRVGGRCPLQPRAGAAGWPRAATSPCARACPSACTWVCVRVRSCVCVCACVCTRVRAGSRRRRGQMCGAPGRVGTVWEERPPGFAQANRPQPLRGRSTDSSPRGASVAQAARLRRRFSGRAAPHLGLGSARPGG